MAPARSRTRHQPADGVRDVMAFAAIAATRSEVEARLADGMGICARQREILRSCAARHARAAMLQEQSAMKLLAADRRMESFRLASGRPGDAVGHTWAPALAAFVARADAAGEVAEPVQAGDGHRAEPRRALRVD